MDFAANNNKILYNDGSKALTRLRYQWATVALRRARVARPLYQLLPPPRIDVHFVSVISNYPSFRCLVFKKKPVMEWWELITKKKLCFVCLCPYHVASSCLSTYLWKCYEGWHSVVFHLDSKIKVSDKTSTCNTATIESSADQNITFTSFSGAVNSNMIFYWDLLDTGSQISVIINQCAIQLGLPRHRGWIEVSGLAQQAVLTLKGLTNCSFFPLLNY